MHTLNVNVSETVHPGIMRHGIAPMSHILHKRLFILLLRQINRLLILPDHPDLAAGSNIRDAEVTLIEPLLDRPLDLPGQDIRAQPRFLTDRSRETDAINRVEGIHHRANGLEAAGDVRFRFRQRGHDGLGEVEEEGLALLGALALVREGEGFVGSAGQLHEVEAVGFERCAEGLAFRGVEAFVLEFNAVDLDAEDE